jgi:hypothetical protein
MKPSSRPAHCPTLTVVAHQLHLSRFTGTSGVIIGRDAVEMQELIVMSCSVFGPEVLCGTH